MEAGAEPNPKGQAGRADAGAVRATAGASCAAQRSLATQIVTCRRLAIAFDDERRAGSLFVRAMPVVVLPHAVAWRSARAGKGNTATSQASRSSGCRTRTYDPAVNSRLLYRLS